MINTSRKKWKIVSVNVEVAAFADDGRREKVERAVWQSTFDYEYFTRKFKPFHAYSGRNFKRNDRMHKVGISSVYAGENYKYLWLHTHAGRRASLRVSGAFIIGVRHCVGMPNVTDGLNTKKVQTTYPGAAFNNLTEFRIKVMTRNHLRGSPPPRRAVIRLCKG